MYLQLLVYFSILFLLAFFGYSLYMNSMPVQDRPSGRTLLINLGFIAYVCAVIALTIIPSERFSLNTTIPLTNYVPVLNTYKRYVMVTWFENYHGIKNFWQNFIGNILLFIPLGLFLPLLFRQKLGGVVAIAFISSFVIESIQFASRYFGYYRHIDVDDVLLNTCGAIAGYFALTAYKRFWQGRKVSTA